MAVDEMDKSAHQRCIHQNGRGCAIYTNRPPSCKVFSCGWLLGMIGKRMKPSRVHAVIHASELFTRTEEEAAAGSYGNTGIKILRVTCDDRKKVHREIADLVKKTSYRCPIVMEYGGFNEVWQKGKVIVTIAKDEFFRFDASPGGFFANVKKVSNDGEFDKVSEIPNWIDTRNVDEALVERARKSRSVVD